MHVTLKTSVKKELSNILTRLANLVKVYIFMDNVQMILATVISCKTRAEGKNKNTMASEKSHDQICLKMHDTFFFMLLECHGPCCVLALFNQCCQSNHCYCFGNID